MTDAEIQAEAHRLATTCLFTSEAEAAIAAALRKAAETPRCGTCRFCRGWVFDSEQNGWDCGHELQVRIRAFPDRELLPKDFGCVLHEPRADA